MAEPKKRTEAAAVVPCVDCKCDLGEPAKVLSMTVDGEAWCPQCFAWKRAHMEAGRFGGDIFAVKCGACGLTSTAFGSTDCGQCGARQTIVLPAKPLVKLA